MSGQLFNPESVSKRARSTRYRDREDKVIAQAVETLWGTPEPVGASTVEWSRWWQANWCRPDSPVLTHAGQLRPEAATKHPLMSLMLGPVGAPW